MLVPIARALPETFSVATPLDNVPVPNDLVPRENVTVPVGVWVPLAGLTVAVIVVLAAEVMLAGLAETVVEVATTVTVTVTVVVPLELVNAMLPP